MAETRAFAVLVNGRDEPPFGSETTYLLPLIELAHHRGLAVGVFDLCTLEDVEAAPGVWFAVGDLEGAAGVLPVPPAAYDRHLDGTADDHRRRLRLAAQRTVINPPSVQALMVDKLQTNRLLREAGLPVPGESPAGRRRGKIIDKPRFGRLGRDVQIRSRRRLRRTAEAMISQEYIEPVPFRGVHPHVKVHVQRDGPDLRAVGAAVRYWPEPYTGSGDLPAAAPISAYAAVIPPGSAPTGGLARATGTLAVQAVRALEGHPGVVHEAGVDIVIGRHGGLTVIEVNSKPGRSSYRLIADDPEVADDLRQVAVDGEAATRRRVVDEMIRRLDERVGSPMGAD